MNSTLKSAIANGELVLFLGAGASRGCKTSTGIDVPDGDGQPDNTHLRDCYEKIFKFVATGKWIEKRITKSSSSLSGLTEQSL